MFVPSWQECLNYYQTFHPKSGCGKDDVGNIMAILITVVMTPRDLAGVPKGSSIEK